MSRDKEFTDSQDKLAEAVLAELDIAVFRAKVPGALPPETKPPDPTEPCVDFVPVSQPPQWPTLFPSLAERWNLTEAFPFLDSFLPDALNIWQMNQEGRRLGSGVWTEVDCQGKSHQFEAIALCRNSTSLLIIAELTRTFDERHHIYQRAREIALANEKLIVQLNQRQRELQDALERRLRDNETLDVIHDSVENNTSAVLICRPDGSIEVMNQALVDIYKVTPGANEKRSMLEKWLQEAEAIYPEIQRVVASGSYWEGEFESYSLAGTRKWVRLTIGPVLDAAGELSHYICIANDISELKKSGEEIEKLTDYDFTTQLPNRRHFWKKLTRILDEEKQQTSTLALIYIDLDNFKKINDSMGHHAGDFLLHTLGARLSRSIKRGDFIAHLGGDEFAILLHIPNAQINLEKVVNRVQTAINKTIQIEDNNLSMTASIGIALYPKDGRDATSLMKHADLAMFHAKNRGPGQYQVFNSKLNAIFMERVQLEHDLEQALPRQEFRLVYQPQVCSGEDHYLRLEALLRWQHPEKGNIPPGHFIPLAEDNGMIIPIGSWVLETACRHAMALLQEDFNVVIAVNISARQVRRPDFKTLVEDVLKRTGLPPKHLELEITETTIMEEMNTVVALLKELKALGISISLDDFGSGFSSLTYLKNLPVDNLKLDRSFIHELPGNEESRAITSTVISLAHELKMKVIAEGVENNEQLAFLQERGCDYMQGYLFYYPLELEKIREIFTSIRGAVSH